MPKNQTERRTPIKRVTKSPAEIFQRKLQAIKRNNERIRNRINAFDTESTVKGLWARCKKNLITGLKYRGEVVLKGGYEIPKEFIEVTMRYEAIKKLINSATLPSDQRRVLLRNETATFTGQYIANCIRMHSKNINPQAKYIKSFLRDCRERLKTEIMWGKDPKQINASRNEIKFIDEKLEMLRDTLDLEGIIDAELNAQLLGFHSHFSTRIEKENQRILGGNTFFVYNQKKTAIFDAIRNALEEYNAIVYSQN